MVGSIIVGQGSLGALNETIELTGLGLLATGGILISGTWAGTIAFQGSIDGTTFDAIVAQPLGGGILAASTTANGRFLVGLAGFATVRLKMAAYTSGTANITAYGTQASVFMRANVVVAGATDSTMIGNRGSRLNIDLAQASTYTNITGNATTTVKTGSGVLTGLLIGDNTTNGTVTVYDNTAGSGTKILGPIQIGTPSGGLLSTSGQQGPVFLPVYIPFTTGCTVVTAGSSNNSVGTYHA